MELFCPARTYAFESWQKNYLEIISQEFWIEIDHFFAAWYGSSYCLCPSEVHMHFWSVMLISVYDYPPGALLLSQLSGLIYYFISISQLVKLAKSGLPPCPVFSSETQSVLCVSSYLSLHQSKRKLGWLRFLSRIKNKTFSSDHFGKQLEIEHYWS